MGQRIDFVRVDKKALRFAFVGSSIRGRPHRVGDVGGVAVGGNLARADLAEVQRRVKLLREAGRDACAVFQVRTGGVKADPTVAAVFDFLSRLHGGDSFRLIWGGGGITISGWLHDDSRERLGALADPLHPLDALSVGLLDSLPLPVAMKVEFVTVSPSKIVQFEQFHPRAGRITIEASSAGWLEACPGGWDGETPPDASWAHIGQPENVSRFGKGRQRSFLMHGEMTCIFLLP